ncbi:hypothetical protein [Clostridium sp. UBA2485]|nr:hypothetical protein [Clostridium sp. UBA2485]
MIVLIILIVNYIGNLFLTSRICIEAAKREEAYVGLWLQMDI